jgi:hypothetical protein
VDPKALLFQIEELNLLRLKSDGGQLLEEKFPLATTPDKEAVILFLLGVIFEGMNVVPPKPGVQLRLGREVQGPGDRPEVNGERLVTVADKDADLLGHGVSPWRLVEGGLKDRSLVVLR